MARFGGMLTDVPVHQVTERAAKAFVGHGDSGRTGGGVFGARDRSRCCARRVAPAGRCCGGDLRTWQCGHADPHRRRDGRRRRGVGRAQRRSLQRKMPTRVGGQHLLDSGGGHGRRRRRGCGTDGLGPAGAGDDGRRRGVAGRCRVVPADRMAVRAGITRPAERMANMATHRVGSRCQAAPRASNVASAASICLYQSARAHRRASRPS